jgi:hypothetical protein
MMEDITKIPTAELIDDLRDGLDDIAVCKTALREGVTSYSGGSVEHRLKVNEIINAKIEAELKRRGVVFTI